MNHCGQSPWLLVLLSKHDAKSRLSRLVMLERQQQLHRALTDVTRAPGRARVLLQAMWHGQMHHGVMRQPRKDRIDSLRVSALSALFMRTPRVMRRQQRSERAKIVASLIGSAYLAASAAARLASVIEPTTANTNSFVGRVRIATKAPLRRLPSG